MTREELRESAMDYLAKAFKGKKVEAHVVHAAVAILVAPEPQTTAK